MVTARQLQQTSCCLAVCGALAGLVACPGTALAFGERTPTTHLHVVERPSAGESTTVRVAVFDRDDAASDWQAGVHVETGLSPTQQVSELLPLRLGDFQDLAEPAVLDVDPSAPVTVSDVATNYPYFTCSPAREELGPTLRLRMRVSPRLRAQLNRPGTAVRLQVEVQAEDERLIQLEARDVLELEAPVSEAESEITLDVCEDSRGLKMRGRVRVDVSVTAEVVREGSARPLTGAARATGAVVIGPARTELVGVGEFDVSVPDVGSYAIAAVLMPSASNRREPVTATHIYALTEDDAVIRSTDAAALVGLTRATRRAKRAAEAAGTAFDPSDALPMMPATLDADLRVPRAEQPEEEDRDRGHGNNPDGFDEDNPGRGRGGPGSRCPPRGNDCDRGHGNDPDRFDTDNPGKGEPDAGLGGFVPLSHEPLHFTIRGTIRAEAAQLLPAGGSFDFESKMTPVQGLEVCVYEDDPGGPFGGALRPDDDNVQGCTRTSESGAFTLDVTLPRTEGGGDDTEFYLAVRMRADEVVGGFIVKPDPTNFEFLFPDLADLFGVAGGAYVAKLAWPIAGNERKAGIGLLESTFIDDRFFGTAPGVILTGTHEFSLFKSTRVDLDPADFMGIAPTDVKVSETDSMGAAFNVFREAFLAREAWLDAGGPVEATFDGEPTFVRIHWPMSVPVDAFLSSSFMLPFDILESGLDDILLLAFNILLEVLVPPEARGATTDVGAITDGEVDRVPSKEVVRDKWRALFDFISSVSKRDIIGIRAPNMFVNKTDVVRHEFGHFIQVHTQGATPFNNFFRHTDFVSAINLCFDHEDGVPNSPHCAFGEGFADFWRVISEQDPFRISDTDRRRIPRTRRPTEFADNQGREIGLNCGRCPAAAASLSVSELRETPGGALYEDRVAAALLDIVDGRSRTGVELPGAGEDFQRNIAKPTSTRPLAPRTDSFNAASPFGAQLFGDWNSVIDTKESDRITQVMDAMRSLADEAEPIDRVGGRLSFTPIRSLTEFVHAAVGRSTSMHLAEPTVFASPQAERGALLAARWNFVFVQVDVDAGCRFGRDPTIAGLEPDIGVFQDRTDVDLRDFGTRTGLVRLPERLPILTRGRFRVADSSTAPTCYVVRRQPLSATGMTLAETNDPGRGAFYVGLPLASIALENELGFVEDVSTGAGAVARVRIDSSRMFGDLYTMDPDDDVVIVPPDAGEGADSTPPMPPEKEFFGITLAVDDFDADGDSDDLFAGTFPNLEFGDIDRDSRAFFYQGGVGGDLNWRFAAFVELRDAVGPAAPSSETVPRQLLGWQEKSEPRLVAVLGDQSFAINPLLGSFSGRPAGVREIPIDALSIEATDSSVEIGAGRLATPTAGVGVVANTDVDVDDDGFRDLQIMDSSGVIARPGQQSVAVYVPAVEAPYLAGSTLRGIQEVAPSIDGDTPTTLGAVAVSDRFGANGRLVALRHLEQGSFESLFFSTTPASPSIAGLGGDIAMPEFLPRGRVAAPTDSTFALSPTSPLAIGGSSFQLRDGLSPRMTFVGPRGRRILISNSVFAFGPPRVGEIVEVRLRPGEDAIGQKVRVSDPDDNGTFGWAAELAANPFSATSAFWLISQPLAEDGAGVLQVIAPAP